MRMKNGAIFMIDDWQAIFIILYNIASFPQKIEKKPKLFISTRNPHSYCSLWLHPKSGEKSSYISVTALFSERKTRV